MFAIIIVRFAVCWLRSVAKRIGARRAGRISCASRWRCRPTTCGRRTWQPVERGSRMRIACTTKSMYRRQTHRRTDTTSRTYDEQKKPHTKNNVHARKIRQVHVHVFACALCVRLPRLLSCRWASSFGTCTSSFVWRPLNCRPSTETAALSAETTKHLPPPYFFVVCVLAVVGPQSSQYTQKSGSSRTK